MKIAPLCDAVRMIERLETIRHMGYITSHRTRDPVQALREAYGRQSGRLVRWTRAVATRSIDRVRGIKQAFRF